MALRNWDEILGEGSQQNRPTVSRWKAGQWRKTPVYSPSEILGSLKDRFRAIESTRSRDPRTGRMILTKTMPRMELPQEMVGRLGESYFQRPETGQKAGQTFTDRFGVTHTVPTTGTFEPYKYNIGQPPQPSEEDTNLDYRWILPKGAYTGAPILSRETPSSDIERMGAWGAGYSDTGQNIATASPLHYPGARFDIPTATTEQGYEFPIFGGVTNLATGEVLPSSLGGRGTPQERQYRMPSYGRFDPTIPQTAFQMGEVKRVQPPRFRYPYHRNPRPQGNLPKQDLINMMFPLSPPPQSWSGMF